MERKPLLNEEKDRKFGGHERDSMESQNVDQDSPARGKSLLELWVTTTLVFSTDSTLNLCLIHLKLL